jgi:hypothetical protein
MRPKRDVTSGTSITRRAHFPKDDPPAVGDITAGFGHSQYRITSCVRWKDRWEVTEVKLHPDDFVEHPDWQMKSPRDP